MSSTDLSLFSSGSSGVQFSESGHGEPNGGHSGGHHVAAESLVIFFLFGGLCLGGLLREVNKKTGIPYTPMLFILGGAIGYMHSDLSLFGEAAGVISHIDPHGMLLIFLPTLIFESGMNADWHVFKKQFVQVIILAVPCVFVGACMLAFCIKVILGYSDDYYTWSSAFMFGSVLSCTDTVAVLALLKEVGAAKKFNCLIEGESLINDGTCMVLLKISAELVKGRSMTGLQITGTFFSLAFGGALIGILFGAISAFWIKKIFNDEVLVVNITFISCYILYFVCENVDLGFPVSGIIALVSLGLFMAAFGKARISTESDHAVHVYWKYIVYVCETIIFLLAGVVVGTKVILGEKEPGALDITFDDYLKLFQLYACMNVVRMLAILVFWKILKNTGYGFSLKELIVLTWGGLRGAIGICFAMIVARDPEYPPTLRHFILFDMSGCALLTLVINAPTAGALVRYVGLASTSETKQRVFLGYIENFMKETEEYVSEIKTQPTSSIIDWAKIDLLIGNDAYKKLINDGYKTLALLSNAHKKKVLGLPTESLRKGSRKKSSKGSNPNEQELLPRREDGTFGEVDDENTIRDEDDAEEKLIVECRDRYLMALKGAYYHLFELSQCGPDSFLMLREATDWDLDDDTVPMSSWDFISASFMNPSYVNAMIKMKNWPVVGKYAKNNLLDHLTLVYDVVTNYINAHEEVDELAKKFPFNEYVLQTILEESERNKDMAEDYIKNYLDVSFPEIRKSIHMKKAAYSILVKQREFITETYNQGQIEEKEFKTLKKTVDKLVYNLSESNDTWDFPDVREFIKNTTFFRGISNEEINLLLKESVERAYSQDEIITKEGNKLESIIIVTRGNATETCKDTLRNFKEKKEGGSIISAHNLVNASGRYLSTVIADCPVYAIVIPVEKVKAFCKKFSVEEHLYRESFFFFTRYFFSELRLFASCNRHIINDQIVPTFEFRRYKVGSIIDMTNGGIFLKGVAVEYNGDQKPTTNTRIKTYSKIACISPSLSQYWIRVTKTTRVFHFKSVDIINELISVDAADKEKQRTLSISLEAGFRKASMLKPGMFDKPNPTHFAHHEIEIKREPSGENAPISLSIPVSTTQKSQLEQIDEKDDL